MIRKQSREKRRAAFIAAAAELFEGMEDWYDAHPAASFGEIEAEARKRQREMMGKGLTI